MSVRGRTLSIGLVLTGVLVVAGSTVSIPYVALGPGVTINTLGTYDGAPIYTFAGEDIPPAVNENFGDGSHLNMTTVSVTDGMTLFGALGLWASGNSALVPREEVYPPGQTTEQVKEENAKSFKESQNSSEIAALTYLKYPQVIYVGTIADNSPSYDVLDPQDQVVAVDGVQVADSAALQAALANTTPGQVVTVTVLRAAPGGSAAQKDLKVTLGKNPDPAAESGRGFLGIVPQMRPVAPFTISNSLAKSDIGGPSAGLMFTLGIIDRLTSGDLTSGHYIAGTGTIDTSGVVGPIGGILMKMIAAKDVGATIFLVPADNCTEALTRVPSGLQLVKVAKLTDATTALDLISKGETPPGC
ncbi:PDZ domain-containing protein [Nakamurella antarctica]|uniref:YlbL family protein n=1 Tax=Nakamurella antarctica TaxID=1902245 RepID=UPI003BAECE60